MTPLQLIATDLDGTFLGADHVPSELNVQAVRLAHERGVHVVFATGRPVRWLQVLDPLSDVHPDVLVSNGAVVYDVAQHEVEQAFPLPREDSLAVMADVAAVIPGATFAVEYTDGWGRLLSYPPRGDFVEADVIVASPNELLTARVPVKLLILHREISTDRLAELATPVVNDRLQVTFSETSGYGLLELSAPG